jgi:hypothetical protein
MASLAATDVPNLSKKMCDSLSQSGQGYSGARFHLSGRNILRGGSRMLEAIPIPRTNVIVLVLSIHEFNLDRAPPTVGIGLRIVTQRIEVG